MMKKTMDELQQQIAQSEEDLKQFEKGCCTVVFKLLMLHFILAVKMATTIYLLVYNCIQWSSFFLIIVNIILLALKGQGA